MSPKSSDSARMKREGQILLFVGVFLLIGLLLFLYLEKRTPAPPPLEVNIPRDTLPAFSVVELEGTVTAAQGGQFSLDVPLIIGVPIADDDALRARTVVPAPNARVTLRANRSNDAILKERARGEGFFSLPFESRSLSLQDIRVGDTVRVSEAGFPDIKFKSTINAAIITKLTAEAQTPPSAP